LISSLVVLELLLLVIFIAARLALLLLVVFIAARLALLLVLLLL